jgi:glycosyltransferase involved in cell wall biosynthesis
MNVSASAGQEPRVSLVVPVYNEEDALPEFQRRVDSAMVGFEGGYEVVYVDDGSADGSAAWIEELAHGRDNVGFVRLSRNFGSEIAMSAGMDYARGAYIAFLPADLQDPPEMIPEMVERAIGEGADVVFGRRIGRDESFLKRTLASSFYVMMSRLARTPYQGQAGDFRVISRRVAEHVCAMPERRRFLRGMISWVGYEQVPVDYRRAGRRAGSGMSYPALIRLAFEALASFSDIPLAIASYLGVALAILSTLAALFVLALAAIGSVSTSVGVWILISVLFLGGAQLISAGILGRYLARVHTQVLERPLYLVERAIPVQRRAADVNGAALRPVSGEAG